MKTITRTLIAAFLLCSAALGATNHRDVSSSTAFGDKVITHIADGGDWKTSITLFNLSNTKPVTFKVTFYNDSGSQQAFPFKNIGRLSQLTGVIATNGSVSFETVGYSNGFTVTGWAYVDTNDSIGGFAIFGNSNGQEATVPLEPEFPSQEILAFDNANGNVMGVALVNPSNFSVVQVTIVFYDRNGAEIGSDSFSMDPNAHVSYVMPQRWPFLTGRVGTANVTTDGLGVAVLGLRFNPYFAFTSVMAIETTPDL
jgi:hypothetical protein